VGAKFDLVDQAVVSLARDRIGGRIRAGRVGVMDLGDGAHGDGKVRRGGVNGGRLIRGEGGEAGG
jgi:hypothetical protein